MIFLHGRDSDGEEFSRLFFSEKSSDGRSIREKLPGWRWVFPTAPLAYNKLVQREIREWFYFESLTEPSLGEELQQPGLSRSLTYIHQLVDEEIKKIPGKQIFLGGASLGCATSITYLLCSNIQFAGLIGFYGWLPYERWVKETDPPSTVDPKNTPATRIPELKKALKRENTSSNDGDERCRSLSTPVLLSHNVDDNVIGVNLGRAMCDTLQSLGAHVTLKEYGTGGHWIQVPHGLDDVIAFLQSPPSLTK